MSNTIFLITEDETDIDVIRALLKSNNIDVRISKLLPSGGSGGISRLPNTLEKLIKTAIQKRKKHDCIAILHDADENVPDSHSSHRKIKQICKKYANEVVLIIARDEIESWLLADEGLCKWLGQKPRNHDEKKQPSKILSSLVKKKTGKAHQGSMCMRVLEKVDGTGHKYSPSMKNAMKHLENAVCTR